MEKEIKENKASKEIKVQKEKGASKEIKSKKEISERGLTIAGLIGIGINIVAAVIIFCITEKPFTTETLILLDVFNAIGAIGVLLIALSLIKRKLKLPIILGGFSFLVFYLMWFFIWLSGTITIQDGTLFDVVSVPLILIAMVALPLAVILIVIGIIMTKFVKKAPVEKD